MHWLHCSKWYQLKSTFLYWLDTSFLQKSRNVCTLWITLWPPHCEAACLIWMLNRSALRWLSWPLDEPSLITSDHCPARGRRSTLYKPRHFIKAIPAPLPDSVSPTSAQQGVWRSHHNSFWSRMYHSICFAKLKTVDTKEPVKDYTRILPRTASLVAVRPGLQSRSPYDYRHLSLRWTSPS